ncbi:MAG TPA: threonine synthase [Solirubrobacteraceae bacterium]|nr:threonine synthase [Solirubrobacteraceae bacterium]
MLIDVPSALTHLEGSASGETYDADRLIGLDPADGRPLLARYDLERAAATLTKAALAARRAGGLWRWAELLPVRERAYRIHLGEGSTPLLDAARLARELGTPGLKVKAEGLNPTGSFKARGMAAAVSRAAELGATALVAPSAGNAGGALAAYGAFAGIPVTVVMPRDVPAVNREEAAVMGARVILHDGLIDDCGAVAREIAAETGAFDVSTLKEPYRVEGKKTMGLELAEDLGWRLPDVIVYPTGGGTGLVGMWKAFAELEALGFIGPERPRMVAVQAEGCAPIVRAFETGAETAERWEGASTRAGGLRVPQAVGDKLILAALRESGGTAVAVSEEALTEAQGSVGRLMGAYVAPESGAAFAAVRALRERGEVGASDEVVVFDCGIGQKYPPPAPAGLTSTAAG